MFVSARAGAGSRQTFPFLGPRCDRLVRSVMRGIAERAVTASPVN